MTEKGRLEVLRRVRELSAVDAAMLPGLLPFFDEVLVPRGVAVAREGRFCHEFLVVAEGEVEVCRKGRATRLGPGESFGWSAMRDRARNDATVVTMSPARLLVMSHSQFRAAAAVAGSTVHPVSCYTAAIGAGTHAFPVEPEAGVPAADAR